MTNCLCFGDSITYGEYDGVYGGWADILKRYCFTKYNNSAKEINVFNLGIEGETTVGLLKRMQIECNARTSEINNLIFIAYGANDLAIVNDNYRVVPNTFKQNLQQAVNIALNTTKHVFLVSILPISETLNGKISATGKLRTTDNIKRYNQIIFDIAQHNAIEYVDTYSTFLKDKENLISKDGIHPNAKGYQVISEVIKPLLSKYL